MAATDRDGAKPRPQERVPAVEHGRGAPDNKPQIRDPALFRRFETAAVTLRLIELRANPVQSTFGFDHLREINRRLYQDVYADAGKLSILVSSEWERKVPTAQTDRALDEIRHDVLARGHTKETMVGAMVGGFNYLDNSLPFARGNRVTGRAFMSQLANVAGYQLDFERAEPGRWASALDAASLANPDLDNSPQDGFIPLRNLVRELLRPHRAAAFEEAIATGNRAQAIERHPELKQVFETLVVARERKGEGPGKSDSTRLAARIQRELDEGRNPENAWPALMERVLGQGRGLSR